MEIRRFISALLAATALGGVAAEAADLPVKAAPFKAPPVVMYNWTGLEVGIHGGLGWGPGDWTYVTSGKTVDYDANGGLIGATIGYHFQIQNWVLGIEGDWDWAGIKGNPPCPNPAWSCESKLNAIGTLRGRVGTALGATGNVLLYATGGWAWASLKVQAVSPGGVAYGTTSTPNGWALGGGIEYGFLPNWSAKLEYLYVDLDPKRYMVVSVVPVDVSERVNIVRAGVSYRFGGL